MSWRKVLPPVLLLAALVGLWQLVVSLRHTPEYVVPGPWAIARAIGPALPLLGGHVATTLWETILGMVVGGLAGVALALAISAWPLVRGAAYPLTIVSQAVPLVVLTPLIAVGFGLGTTPKVFVVAMIVFFPVLVNAVGGLDGADAELVDVVRSMGASRLAVYRVVRIPAAVPAVFAGLRISAAYAVGGAVIGEYVGATSGLGLFIDRSWKSYLFARTYVGVLVVVVLSLVLFGLVALAGRLAAPWTTVHATTPGASR